MHVINTSIKTELFDYQKEAVEKCSTYTRFLVCCSTGLGKSLIALRAFDLALYSDQVDHCLILSPKSAVGTWVNQTNKHTNFSISGGRVNLDADISIVSYSQLDNKSKTLNMLLAKKRVYLILDEAHVLSSGTSNLSITLTKAIKCTTRALGLTATPISNHINEAYHLYNAFFPGALGTSYEAFLCMYTKRFTIGKGRRRVQKICGYKHLDHLHGILNQLMYRKSIDYDLTFHFGRIEPTAPEMKSYLDEARKILEEVAIAKKEGGKRARKAASIFASKLPQLQRTVNLMSSKMAGLMDLLQTIQERGEAVIIFSFLSDAIKAISDNVKHNTQFNNYYRLEGNTSSNKRKKIEDNFKQGDLLLCSSAGSASLNLQEANNVIFFDSPWSVRGFAQSIGRIARIDSRFVDKNIYTMGVLDTIDMYKEAVIRSKLHLISQIVGGDMTYDGVYEKISQNQMALLRKELLWRIK